MNNFLLSLFALMCVLSSKYADGSDFAAKLKEAEDYLTVNPAHTLRLIDTLPSSEKLTPEQTIQWNIIALRASVQTNQMDKTIQSLHALFELQQHPLFLQNVTAITSALGIWLRRNNYLQAAQLSYECALKYAETNRQRLTLTNSMALVARQLDQHNKSKHLFLQARAMATDSDQIPIIAIVENNLGLLALEQGDIKQAEQHFRVALATYQSISHRAGQISAAINLLFAFLIQDDYVNFQRLQAPTATLVSNFPNRSKKALLMWLEARFQQTQGTPVDTELKAKLLDAYLELEDSRLKTLVQTHFALPMNIEITTPTHETATSFSAQWFSDVEQCDWPLTEASDSQ